MEKIELVMKRMQWKAYFYNEKKDDKKNNKDQTIPETYSFRSLNCSPH